MPSVIMAAYKIGLLTNYGKKHKKQITCNSLVQYKYCLTNGIFNNLAPLQSLNKFYCLSTEICRAFRKHPVDKKF
jgi:hypothetical protein